MPDKGTNADKLAVAMNRNDNCACWLRAGHVDLVSPSATARYATTLAALPADRLTVKSYASRHEVHLDGDGGPADVPPEGNAPDVAFGASNALDTTSGASRIGAPEI